MKKYEIVWEDMAGNAAGIGLDDIVEGENKDDVLDSAEYYYFLDRGEDHEGRHRCIVTEI